MEIERYFEQIVAPTIADFEANPTSAEHTFLAAVAQFVRRKFEGRRDATEET